MIEVIGTSADTQDLVAYSLIKAPFTYVGKVVRMDIASGTLQLNRVLLLMTNPKDGNIAIQSVPFASRESTVTINMNVLEGLVIDKLEDMLVSTYNKEIVSAYSNLML